MTPNIDSYRVGAVPKVDPEHQDRGRYLCCPKLQTLNPKPLNPNYLCCGVALASCVGALRLLRCRVV